VSAAVGDRGARSSGPCSPADRFATELGARLLHDEVGCARVELLADARHCNDLGAVHGGVLFALVGAARSSASAPLPQASAALRSCA
jgi:acyl-coenzyme A thioesterase PaaI-like protein